MSKPIIGGLLALFLLGAGTGTYAAGDHHDLSHAIVHIDGLPVAGGPGELVAPKAYFAKRGIKFEAQVGRFPSGTQFRWSWGDGESDSDGATAKHTFADPDTYIVTLQSGKNDYWKTEGKIRLVVAASRIDAQEVALWGSIGVAGLVLVLGTIWWRRRRHI